MPTPVDYRKTWLFVMLLALGMIVLSACGVNMSGEPAIIDEFEIRSTATPPPSPTPDATATPANTDTDADPDADTDADPDADADSDTDAGTGSDADTDMDSDAAPGTDDPDPGADPDPDAASDADTATATDTDTDTAPDRTIGRQLFLAECATCHGGQDGIGPGIFTIIESADTRVDDLTGEEYLYQSIVEPGAFIVEGYEDGVMPGDYGDRYSEFELNSMVAFLAEASAPPSLDQIDETPTPPVATDELLLLQGRLVQGSADGDAIPPDLPMELFVLNSAGQFMGDYQATSDDDATFEFEDVARGPGFIYLIRVDYDDVLQGAQVGPIQGDEDVITQDVTVYDRTTDGGSIRVRWAEALINFAPINEFGLEVWLTLELVNTGDRIVTTDETADTGWLVSVPVELPVGSFGIQPMQSEGSNRFQVDVIDGVPIVKDTWPLRPGRVHTMTVAYYLPYDSAAEIDHAFTYPVVDAVVLMPNDTVEFASEQFDTGGEWRYRVSSDGTRVTELSPDTSINPDRDFTLVKAHDLLAPVDAGEHLVFTLEGRPTRTINVIASAPTASTSGDDDETDLLPIALFVLGAGIIALAGVLWWRGRETVPAPAAGPAWQAPPANADKATLLRAVVELDNAYEAGQLDDETYNERRATLLGRLVPLLDEDELDHD